MAPVVRRLCLICLPFAFGVALLAQTPSSPAFEVASIKLNRSGDAARSDLGLPAGRFTATNVPLKQLIVLAYGIRPSQLIGGPNWIASDRFDINAKADVPLTPATVGPYIRQLLIERFRLTTHNENRDAAAYALVLARSDGRFGPELQRPDRDYCAEAVARQGRGLPPAAAQSGQPARCLMNSRPGTLIVRSMPLTNLAGALTESVGRSVVDRTGLEGVFDLTLKWTPEPLSASSDSAGPAVSGPSVFAALQEQLGLKLEPTRATVAGLVIDRVEHPTED
jgi:uncharacterized protein (TIGR03435 family)